MDADQILSQIPQYRPQTSLTNLLDLCRFPRSEIRYQKRGGTVNRTRQGHSAGSPKSSDARDEVEYYYMCVVILLDGAL